MVSLLERSIKFNKTLNVLKPPFSVFTSKIFTYDGISENFEKLVGKCKIRHKSNKHHVGYDLS